jgi:hypothetical protein
MSRTTPLEQRITELLSQLMLSATRPAFSFRVDEIRAIGAELVACWARYRQGRGAGDTRPLGVPTTRHLVNFPYTRDELQALFAVACWEDVEHGGCYDVWSMAMTLWTRPWPPEWDVPRAEDSALRGTFHFAWGNPPGLWLVETDVGFTLQDLLRELGHLELKALGHLKHGDMPPERRRRQDGLGL